MCIFHIIGMSETVLTVCLPAIACGTHVSILHIISAQETQILICKHIDKVGEAGCRLLSRWLYTGGYVWDDASAANIRDWGGHRGTAASATTFATGTSFTTLSTAASTTLKRIGGFLLETLDRGVGHILLRWWEHMYCCVLWQHSL